MFLQTRLRRFTQGQATSFAHALLFRVDLVGVEVRLFQQAAWELLELVEREKVAAPACDHILHVLMEVGLGVVSGRRGPDRQLGIASCQRRLLVVGYARRLAGHQIFHTQGAAPFGIRSNGNVGSIHRADAVKFVEQVHFVIGQHRLCSRARQQRHQGTCQLNRHLPTAHGDGNRAVFSYIRKLYGAAGVGSGRMDLSDEDEQTIFRMRKDAEREELTQSQFLRWVSQWIDGREVSAEYREALYEEALVQSHSRRLRSDGADEEHIRQAQETLKRVGNALSGAPWHTVVP